VKAVVTGSRGLLGSEVMRYFTSHGTADGWSSGAHKGYWQVDVTDQQAIDHALDLDQPDVIIHCAANPNIAACQADPAAARELNALAVRKIAASAAARKVRIVYVSTDYVFSGAKDGYTEDDQPDPLQVYGRTKAEGERYCLATADGLVVRLPLLYGTGHVVPKATFPEQVLRNLRTGKEVPADEVEIRQPTLTVDVAEILHQLAEQHVTGIVHVAAQQGITKYQWAVGIAEEVGLDPSLIRPTRPSANSNRPARSFLLDRRLRELGISPPRAVQSATRVFFHQAGLLRNR
jgi:dTDP-4-dehydrorhamnose reductase